MKHIKPLYKSSDEAFVLRSYLHDNVKLEIENLGDDVNQIWCRLDQKFGSQRKLIDAIVNDIKQLRVGEQDSPEGALKMISIVEKAFCDLKSMGHEHQLNNTVMISKIEEVMPLDMKREWVKIVADDDDIELECNEFENYLTFFTSVRRE